MIVRYVNHAGAEFVLYGDGLGFIDPNQLHGWAWEYELTSSLSGLGGSARNFARRPRAFDIELRLRGYTREEFLERMNRLHAVADADSLAGEPGRLYVDDQYLRCFLAVVGGEPTRPRLSNYLTRAVTVLAVEPYWCTEVEYNIFPGSGSGGEPGDHGKKYDNRYAYRYGTGMAGNRVVNTHYAAAPAIITMYGAATNPSAVIGGNTYGVNVTLTASQRLVIDQIRHTITVIGGTGVKTNAFNARNKAYDIFKPIPVGDNPIVYSGEFAMSVTLVYQRSELLWTE